MPDTAQEPTAMTSSEQMPTFTDNPTSDLKGSISTHMMRVSGIYRPKRKNVLSTGWFEAVCFTGRGNSSACVSGIFGSWSNME